jgi:hypothetical protein
MAANRRRPVSWSPTMPIDYRIEPERGIIIAALRGQATLAEGKAYVAATIADPAYSPDLVEVLDARELTEPDAAAATFDAALLLTHVAIRQRVQARAIIAPDDMVHALAQHYADETQPTGVPTRVFRDPDAALAWAQLVAWSVRRMPSHD